jgi:hypothetical protein
MSLVRVANRQPFSSPVIVNRGNGDNERDNERCATAVRQRIAKQEKRNE